MSAGETKFSAASPLPADASGSYSAVTQSASCRSYSGAIIIATNATDLPEEVIINGVRYVAGVNSILKSAREDTR